MAAPALTRVTTPAPAFPGPDRTLPGLLRRLIEPAAPRLADALLARPPGESDATLLAVVSRWPGMRHHRAEGCEALVGVDRVLCVPRRRRAVLLERNGSGWTMSLSGAPGVAAAEERVVALFPCDVWYLGEKPRSATLDGSAVDGRLAATLSVALKLMAQVLGLALPVTMLLIVDRVVTQGAVSTLVALLIGLLLLTGFQYLFLWLHVLVSVRRSELTAHPERLAMLRALLVSRDGARWSAAGFDALQGCVDDARFAAETRPQFIADVVFVLLLVALMAAFSIELLAVVAGFAPLYLLADAWGGAGAKRAGEQMTVMRSDLARRFLEAVAAVDVIRGLGLAGHVVGHWRDRDADLAAVRSRQTVRRRQAALLVEFLQKLSVIAIMLLGVGAVIDATMTLGQYIAFNLLAMQHGQPVLRLAAFRRAHQDRRVSAAARKRLEQRCRESSFPAGGSLSLPRRQRLSLQVDRLELANRDSQAVGSLSFALLGGAWLGVSGPSGCGKSTLLRNIVGIEAPRRGTVRLNGVDVRLLRRDRLAARVRLVPQEPAIFTMSVADNIRLGDPAAAPERIAEVAVVCGLAALAEKLPEHLNTWIGSGGRPLSGGERQRIALARALLCQPELLLLDEATAALDARGETELLDAVRRYLPEAAVVLVAHRSGSLLGCREILRLDRLDEL